eukprot:scaffold1048_cov90-Amphora_coffeaeformis.AAC.9
MQQREKGWLRRSVQFHQTTKKFITDPRYGSRFVIGFGYRVGILFLLGSIAKACHYSEARNGTHCPPDSKGGLIYRRRLVASPTEMHSPRSA